MKLLLLSLLLIPTFASAQNKQPPPTYARLVFIGNMPQFGPEKLVDGVRQMADFKPGEMPPLSVTVKNGDLPFVLQPSLNLIDKVEPYSHKVDTFNLLEGQGDKTKKWFEFPKPKKPLSLGIVFQNPAVQKMTWDDPRAVVVDDGPKAFPLQKFRMINLSPMDGLVKIGKGKAAVIKRGDSQLFDLKEGPNKVIVGYRNKKGKIVKLHDNIFVGNPKERIQGFLFRPQGNNKKKVLDFIKITELMPKVPKS